MIKINFRLSFHTKKWLKQLIQLVKYENNLNKKWLLYRINELEQRVFRTSSPLRYWAVSSSRQVNDQVEVWQSVSDKVGVVCRVPGIQISQTPLRQKIHSQYSRCCKSGHILYFIQEENCQYSKRCEIVHLHAYEKSKLRQ